MIRASACLTGVGMSQTGRSLGRAPLDLAVEAALAAIDDAGLTVEDVDGVAAFVPDDGSVRASQLQEALGIEVEWYLGCMEGASQLAALWESFEAVASGRARHVVAFHASNEGTVRATRGRGGFVPGTARAMPERATGLYSWWLPMGAPSAVNIIAMYAQRHFEEYGTTREQLAQFALVQRENAALNPSGIYRAPLSLDDYFHARMISEPLCLLDCDVPIDFSAAVIVSRPDAVSGLRRPPLTVEAVGTARHARPTWDQATDLTTMPVLRDAADHLWSLTDIRATDVDVAALYDGFSFIALAWLEALGFCGPGEGGPFIEGGERIRRDGQLPVNTDGGQLSAGRMHGWGFVPEVCLQLWGDAGARQVPNDPEVGLVACGGGVTGGTLLVTRE